MDLPDWDVSNSHSHDSDRWASNLHESPLHNHALQAVAARRTGRAPPFQDWRSAAAPGKDPHAARAYLKYLGSGGFWPFFVGMRKPSALTM
jgi:hypothetical protein